MSHADPSAPARATLSEVPGTELRQLSATFDSFREFVERYSPWLSDSCIFVETLASVPVGAPVRLEIHLRGQPMLIRALGQVDWIRTAADSEEGPPGVALNISYLDAASARLIDSIFRLYAGEQSAAMGEEVTENWEMDVESLIDDAFPGGEAAPAGNVTAAEPPAEPPATPRLEPAAGTAAASPAGRAVPDDEIKPWSPPSLKPIGDRETPPPDLVPPTVEEPEAPPAGEEIEELGEIEGIEELEVPEIPDELEVELDEMPEISLEPEADEMPEISLEPEAVEVPDSAAEEAAVAFEEPETAEEVPEVTVEEPEGAEVPEVTVEEPQVAAEVPEAVFEMPAFTEEPEATFEAPPTAYEVGSPPTPAAEAPVEAAAPSPPPAAAPGSGFEERLSAAFSESPSAAEASPAASDFGFGLVDPDAADAAAPEPELPPLEDDEDDLTEPVAPAPSLPAAGLSGAPSVAMSTSDRSFLNRSILLFLVAVVAAGLLFIILRNRPRTVEPAPPAGEATASLPAAATPVASPEAVAPPAGETTPARPEPAAQTTPPEDEPAAQTAPPEDEPAAKTAPPEDEPAAETAPPEDEPAAEAAPAATAPEPPPAAVPAPDPAALAGDVERLVKTWAAAWSAQRPEDYIACYAPGYSPPGLSRRDWEAQRQARIRAPASLVVEARDFDIEIVDATHARATFFQDYATDEKRLVTWKTMELERLPEGWRITSERAGRR